MNMNEQVQETLRSMNEEQRDGLIGWLKKGDGHSVAGIERYTDLGLPREWLDTMVTRRWSEFVQIPEGITKVANDAITHQPIGWHAKHEQWVMLLTPLNQEAGYLDNNYRTFTTDRTRSVWCELNDYEAWDGDEYDIECNDKLIEHIKFQHNIHPDAEYWSHRMMTEEEASNCGYGMPALTMEFRLAYLAPDVQKRYKIDTPVEYIETEIDSPSRYLIKYDGTKRVEHISIGKYANFNRQSRKPMLTYDEAVKQVEKKMEKVPNLAWIAGSDVEWKVDGEFRPVDDIAIDLVKESADEIEGYAKGVSRMKAKCPALDTFVQYNEDYTKYGIDTDAAPVGWVIEDLHSLNYTGVLWNHNYMMPWVDGIGNSAVIRALGDAIGADMSGNSMIGRGFSAQYNANCVVKQLDASKWCTVQTGDEEE